MSSQQTLQTLPLECLIEIVSYLSLPECLELRTFCSQLKAAVDDHFRFVKTLPVVLSAPSSHAEGLDLEAYYQETRHDRWWRNKLGNVTIGPPALPHRCLTMFEAERILDEQSQHFRREDFLVLPNTSANLDGFVEFITKYMPKVSKLAVLIDCVYNSEHIQRILNIYQAQLKVLLLDTTARSCWRRPSESEDDEVLGNPLRWILQTNPVEVTEEWFDYIDSFEALEKLYFFPSPLSKLDLTDLNLKFIEKLFRKFKVLHVNSAVFLDDEGNEIMFFYRFKTENMLDTIEEILCEWNWETLNGLVFNFPELKKWICTNGEFGLFNHFMSKLETFHLNGTFEADCDYFEALDLFPKLEHFQCYRFNTESLRRDIVEFPEYVQDYPVNQTIKHIVIDNLPSDQLPVETLLNEVKVSLPFFAALEDVTIREPYTKLTVAELRALP